jgi:dienelactone hydrolase
MDQGGIIKKIVLLISFVYFSNTSLFAGSDIWGAGEVPRLTDSKQVPQTIEELWEGYEQHYDQHNPLEAKIYKTWEVEGDIVVNWVQLTVGTFQGKKALVSGYWAYPKGAKGLPGIVMFNGGPQTANEGVAVNWARLGYACFHPNHNDRIEMVGEAKGLPNTDWGAVNAWGAKGPDGPFQVDEKTIDAVPSPRNDWQFPRQMSGRRIISFICRQPQVDSDRIGVRGHSTGGVLTSYVALDPRVAAAVPSVGGVGGFADKHPVITGNTRHYWPEGARLELFNNTLESRTCWKKMHAPVLLLGASNDFNAPDWNCLQAMKEATVDKRYASCANYNHAFPPETMIADYLWFQDKLKGEFSFPQTPKAELILDRADGVPVFRVTPPKTKLKLKRVEIYYTDGRNPLTRFWITGESKQNADGSWEIQCPLVSRDEPLMAFANVIYAIDPIQAPHHRYNGLSEMAATSDYAYAWPEQLQAAGVKAQNIQSRLIDDFASGLRDWTGSLENNYWWTIRSRKVANPRFMGPKGAELVFEVNTPEAGSYFGVRAWRNYMNQHIAEGQFYGFFELPSQGWNTIRIKTSDLKNRFGWELDDWHKLSMIELCSAGTLKRDVETRYGGKIEDGLIGGQPKEKFTLQVGRVPDKVSGWNESYYTEAGDAYTKFNMVSKDDLLARQRFRNMRWEGGEAVERTKPYEVEKYVRPTKTAAADVQDVPTDSALRQESRKPLAHWKFDDRITTDFASGKRGQALFFGGGKSHVDVGDLGAYESLTIAFWLRPESHARPYSAIMSCRDWQGTAPHLLLLGNGHLRFSVKEGAPVDLTSTSSLANRLGQWVHVAVVVDGKDQKARLYLDGQLDFEHSLLLPGPLELTGLWLGGWNGGDRFLHAGLDDVRIYGEALPTGTLASIMTGEAAAADPVAWWKLDGDVLDKTGAHHGERKDKVGDLKVRSVQESAGKRDDRAEGFIQFAGQGVKGGALKFDGSTSKVVRTASDVPSVDNGVTFEAWIAPQVYPWNWTAILNQEADHQAGWFFGMSGEGTIGLHIAKDGQWIECNSKSRLPLLKWSHVAGTYDPLTGLKVYINGQLERAVKTTGAITPAPDVDLWLGRSHTKTYPIRTERSFSKTFLSPMVFDGLIDEVKIYARAANDDEVAAAFAALQPKVMQPLEYRVLPSGPEGQAKEFGAVYTRLRYAPEWEHHWRVGEDCDILVRFDESPSRIVFWRGMNYSASYVSENGLWAGDQSLEVNSHEKGCFEHMADKRCEFSSAKIVENNAARVVVHARYACVGIDGSFRHGDPETGWGIWADEYYTIYPDGVTVRHMVAENHNGGGQWQETILFNQPGSRPEDTVEIEALTLANIDGESHTYSWENGPPIQWSPKLEDRLFSKPSNANIQLVNFRSEWKPYIIFEPETKIQAFGIPPSKDYSKFACWNHWPVAQLPNDGRKTIVSDRPSHFTLSNAGVKIHRDESRAYLTMLYGMTDQPAAKLAPLSKSWNAAPSVTLKGRGFTGGSYDKSQRAYVFTRTDGNALEFTLEANDNAPVHHPAFVVENWGKRPAKLKLNGQEIARGKKFRLGYHTTLDGTNLVVWVKTQGAQKTTFNLTAVD